jgi:hypothetical protein
MLKRVLAAGLCDGEMVRVGDLDRIAEVSRRRFLRNDRRGDHLPKDDEPIFDQLLTSDVYVPNFLAVEEDTVEIL